MRTRSITIVSAGLALLVLAWWLLRPSARVPGDDPVAAVSTQRPGAEPSGSSMGPGASVAGGRAQPGVHLPQIQAGPDDIDPERRGPSNLPAGTERTRLAASGKLAHYVIEEYAESFRECYEQHVAADPDIPTRALLEFRIEAEPRDTGDTWGQVREVQVLTGGPDYDLMEHDSFEVCCTAAVIELQLDPPGGRSGGEMRFGMTIDLDSGELVDDNRGAGQAQ